MTDLPNPATMALTPALYVLRMDVSLYTDLADTAQARGDQVEADRLRGVIGTRRARIKEIEAQIEAAA